MLVSYQWLNEFVNLENISAQQLGDKMSVTGIEVEGIEEISAGLKKIVIGFVTETKPHPDSDHLTICQVDLGDEISQIICGAPNIATGQKVIVALPGARIGDNVKIKKGKIRGEVSNGMICALQELGIAENLAPKDFSEGIYVLPEDAPIGMDALEYLGFNDPVIELSITPNRADALSMHGVAYEVAAIYNQEVRFPEVTFSETGEKISDHLSVTVDDEDTLSYNLRIIENVKIAPSPVWLQMRLIKEGIRPINNVVDVTNYVLLEYGQPLHAFDKEHLTTNKIHVRKATAGEKLVTLDGEERELTVADSVITDGDVPVALAGVMGGLDSEITEKTQNVVIEAAVFSSKAVRLTSQRFNLRSESSSRFEKGINVDTVTEALDRAVQLMQQLAGGEILQGTLTGKTLDVNEPIVEVSLGQINQYLGTELTVGDVLQIFAQLQFPTTETNNIFAVTVPLRRWDISIAADLIEEVARIYGYDRLPTTFPKGESTLGALTDHQRFTKEIRHSLNGAGLIEAISYALTTPEKAQQFVFGETKNSQLTKLMWPMSEERSVLRLNLISGLLDDIAYNTARKNKNLAFYEIGRVFVQKNNPLKDLPDEQDHLAIALTGNFGTDTWQEKAEKVDFYTVKGLLERLEEIFGMTNIRLEKTAEINELHPGQSGKIYFGDDLAGIIGKVHPEVAGRYDISDTFVLELSLPVVFAHTEKIHYQAVSKFPTVSRDLALLVGKEVSHQDISALIKEKGPRYLQSVKLFDVYQGKGIGEDQKSLAYSLQFSSSEETLTDEQIEQAVNKIIKALETEFKVVLR
ncbi:phenylalanine--tRNA ligase subunit beta [Enterococcus timonensis]|uniref:phenylalanine--tRNA ligase subunit beta n=1 Tax=Enterococcus timonensis TaxID=1852364 RepID=UPI0008D9C5FC|nr:phenylalanine--tRNA ligase subunit beta [Enterococcus timonensis]